MREILFRGKRFCNNEWVEGFLIQDREFYGKPEHRSYIVNHSHPSGCYGGDIYFEVYLETVGQYTGMTDKNGKRIFEGDILSFPDTGEDGYEYKEGYDFTNVAVVCWNYGRWELKDYGDYNSGVKDDMDCSCHFDFITTFLIGEVIGNIYDNPELIAEVEG